jgi:outer membrane autotransporter protein
MSNIFKPHTCLNFLISFGFIFIPSLVSFSAVAACTTTNTLSTTNAALSAGGQKVIALVNDNCYVIPSGVTIQNSGWSTIMQGGSAPTNQISVTNSGTIGSLTSGAQTIDVNAFLTLVNSGVIQSSSGGNNAWGGMNVTNNAGATIYAGSGTALSVLTNNPSVSSNMTVLNNGTISSANGDGIDFGGGGTLSVTNNGTISGTGSGFWGIYTYNGGINSTIINAGIISVPTGGIGIYNTNGIIKTITNTGSITVASGGQGISNTGTITTLNNAQGAASALSYKGNLPSYYNIIINSPTSYGKLAVTNGALTTTFGIYTGSTVANGTYGSVLSGTGITLAATTGSYNSATWTLINSSGSIWDLIISGATAGGGGGGSGSGTSSAYRSNTISYLRNHAAGAAGMLDSLYTNTAMSGVMTALDGLSGAAQANAVAQTLPVITGAASQATTGTMQALNQVIQGRSNSLRGMSSGDEYIGNRDVWMKGFGSWANQNDVNGVAGYKVNTGGLAIGVDQGFTPKLNIGAVLALSNSGVSSNSSSAPSGVTINSYQAGLYGDYAIEKNIIANAQADIGINQNKEYRNITFMGTNANGAYNSYAGHVGTGVKYLMPIDMENTFIPSVRVDYTTVQSQAYTEAGAGALNLSVAKQTYNTLIPSADVRIDHSLDSKMTLSANAGAGYNTLNNQVSATSAYAGGGTTFATNGLQVSPWLYNAGVGVTGQIDKNLQLNVRYDNVFSPTGYMNQMVSAKLKIPL